MCGAYSYDEHILASALDDGSMVFEYGITAFPYGPNNQDKITPVYSQGFAIANGAKAPKSMGKFIDLMIEENNKAEENTYTRYNITEHQSFIASLTKKINHVNYAEGVMTNGFGSFHLLDSILNGGDINKKVDEFEPEFKKQVEEINEFLGS